jgi:hypothetical protein
VSEGTGQGGGSHRLLRVSASLVIREDKTLSPLFNEDAIPLRRPALVFSSTASATISHMLLAPRHEELSDEEIARVLRQLIVDAGCLSRDADVLLAGFAPTTSSRACGRQDCS